MKKIMRDVLAGNGAATNSIYLSIVSLITAIIGIIIAKILSVNLSLQDYGTYSQALLLTTTLTSFTTLGLSTAANYFYNRTNLILEKNSYAVTILAIQFVIGAFCGLLLIHFRIPVSEFISNPSLSSIIYIIAFMPLLTNIINIYQVLFVSNGRAQDIAFRNLLVSLIKLCTVLYVSYRNKNISIILLVILLTDNLQIIYFHLLYIKRCQRLDFKYVNFNLLRPILLFSIPFAVYAMSGSIANDIDKYVISRFCDLETVAIYSNAAKRLPFAILTDSFITVLAPIITRLIGERKVGDAKNVFRLYLKLGYISTFIVGFGALILSKYLMCFLYDKKYLPGLAIFIIYIAVEMIRFANVTILLTASGKTAILMINSIMMLILNAVLDIVTYRILGIIGPAIMTLALSILNIVILLYFGARELQSKVFDLFDFKQMFVVLLESVLVSIPVLFLADLIEKIIIDKYIIIFGIPFTIYCVILGILNVKRIIKIIKEINSYR